jgi:hypothetical protein
MGLFDKKEGAVASPAAPPAETIDTPVNPWAEQQKNDAKDRLREAGMPAFEVTTRDQAEEVLRRRSMAVLELGFVYEQYAKAKSNLEQFINDISLAYDESLAVFMKKNNPTGKKTWSLQYGDLKVMNKPESIALDTERDFDESQFQAWLKTQAEKNPELAKRLKISPLVRYGRDMKEFAAWVKEQKTPPAVPGIKRTPARENVFSISPSLDTAKDKIKEDLKVRGLR